MSHLCFKCGALVSLPPSGRPARGDSCDKCGADLKACKNCRHFDAAAYNQCREPSAERVVEKERANFCDFFAYREGQGGTAAQAGKVDPRKALDDLFKK